MRNEIDHNYHFGAIKMWQNDNHKKQIGVLVEAKADEKFFSKHFNKNTTFFCCNGWETVLKTQQEVNKNNINGVLAIIDADFKRIENKVPTDKNIFLTDFHDIEIMMFHSKAWDQIVSYYVDHSKLAILEKKNDNNLKNILLQLARPIACIRLLNERKNLKLKFKSNRKKKIEYLSYSKFIDPNTLNFSLDELQVAIENKSSKPNFFKTRNNSLNQLLNQDFDLSELCNGHDLINIFSLTLEKAISNYSNSSKIQPERISRELTIAYSFEDFQQTQLYQSLKIWGNKYSLSIFNSI